MIHSNFQGKLYFAAGVITIGLRLHLRGSCLYASIVLVCSVFSIGDFAHETFGHLHYKYSNTEHLYNLRTSPSR